MIKLILKIIVLLYVLTIMIFTTFKWYEPTISALFIMLCLAIIILMPRES